MTAAPRRLTALALALLLPACAASSARSSG